MGNCPRCGMQYGCSCSDWQIRYWAEEWAEESDRRHQEAEDYIENRRREYEEPCNLNRR